MESPQGSLFGGGPKKSLPSSAAGTVARPLAERMRPRSLEEWAGHEEHLLDHGPLAGWFRGDFTPSLILWGPPGCGKTSLGRLLATTVDGHFIGLSAVSCGLKEIRESAAIAENKRAFENRSTILFLDEIHRFNRTQQDALLPHVESGLITLIGATTENPSFELNAALLSRVHVLTLKPLGTEALASLIHRALSDRERGFGRYPYPFSERWVQRVAELGNGDARRTLTLLETIATEWFRAYEKNKPEEGAGEDETLKALEVKFEAYLRNQKILLRYDANQEEHYDLSSALIKSMRDSDPDAAIYYLARMIEGGEDLMFICRRLVIFAAEDIGLADPQALILAQATQNAVHLIGMPEGRIPMALAAAYLARAPKDNSAYLAIGEALAEVGESGNLPVPMHLRNAPTKMMKNKGYGEGYQYAHNLPGKSTGQSNLPKSLKDRKFLKGAPPRQ